MCGSWTASPTEIQRSTESRSPGAMSNAASSVWMCEKPMTAVGRYSRMASSSSGEVGS